MSAMEFFSSKRIKHTRKERTCAMCLDPIPAGSTCYEESGKFYGDFFDRYLHEHCCNAEALYCAEVDTEFSWDDIMEFTEEVVCKECPHWCQNEDEDGYKECPYRKVTNCPKFKEIFKDKTL